MGEQTWRRIRRGLGPLLLCAGLVALLYGLPLCFDRHLAVDDSLSEFWPLKKFFFEGLRRGTVATWCPHVFGGFPLFAMPNAAPAYLPDWPFHLTLPSHSAMDASFLSHVLFAGLGSFLFCRSQGMGRAAALLAALVVEGNGWVWRSAMASSKLQAYAWLPWILLLVTLLFRGRFWAGPALAVAGALLVCTGHVQVLSYLAAWALLFALLTHVWLGRRGKGARAWGALALAAVLALGLSAVAWRPLWDLWRDSPRQQLSTKAASYTARCGFEDLEELLAPEDGPRRAPADSRLPFVGTLVLLLAGLAFLHPERRIVRFFGASALGALLLGFGRIFPFYELHRLLPGQAGFRHPHRFDVILALSLSFLAGFGADLWFRVWGSSQGRDIRRTVVKGASLLLGVLVILMARGAGATVGASALRVGGLSVAFALLSTKTARRRGSRLAFAGLCFLLCGDLFLQHRLDGEVAVAEAFRLDPAVAAELGRFSGRFLPTERDSLRYLGPRRRGPHWPLLPPERLPRPGYGLSDNLPAAWSLPSLWGSTQLLSRRWASFAQLGGRLSATTPRDVPEALRDSRLALAVSSCATVTGPSRSRSMGAPSWLRQRGRVGSLGFWSHGGPVATLRLVPRLRVLHREEELWKIFRHGRGQPGFEGLVLESDLPPSLRGGAVEGMGSRSSAGECHVERIGSEFLRIRLPEGASGFLIASHTWTRGWKARVRGRPRVTFPVDGRSLAMVVESGDRVVELRYEDPSLRWARPRSLVAALVLLIWVAVLRRRSRDFDFGERGIAT